MREPPIHRWEEDEALRALVRLARELPDVDADEARRRLGRLTDQQRAVVEEAVRVTPRGGCSP